MNSRMDMIVAVQNQIDAATFQNFSHLRCINEPLHAVSRVQRMMDQQNTKDRFIHERGQQPIECRALGFAKPACGHQRRRRHAR